MITFLFYNILLIHGSHKNSIRNKNRNVSLDLEYLIGGIFIALQKC